MNSVRQTRGVSQCLESHRRKADLVELAEGTAESGSALQSVRTKFTPVLGGARIRRAPALLILLHRAEMARWARRVLDPRAFVYIVAVLTQLALGSVGA